MSDEYVPPWQRPGWEPFPESANRLEAIRPERADASTSWLESESTTVARIEHAIARIRNVRQSRTLLFRASTGLPSAAARVDTARIRYLNAIDGTTDNVTMSEIAADIGVDRPRASRLTAELEADGLIERVFSDTNLRTQIIRLTAAGRRLVGEIRTARRRSVAEALAFFSDDEERALADLLERFASAWPVVDGERFGVAPVERHPDYP